MKKKLGLTLLLAFIGLAATSCSSSSSGKKGCGGETCRVGDKGEIILNLNDKVGR